MFLIMVFLIKNKTRVLKIQHKPYFLASKMAEQHERHCEV